MFALGILIIILLGFYGVKGMATLAIFMDKLKFGNKGNLITDNIPPAPPTIWADFTATNSATVRIYGISEPESTIYLMRGEDRLMEKKADKDGKLIFDDVNLKLGMNEFLATAIDSAGNISHQSRSLGVTFANKGPEITIEKPIPDQKFSGADNPIEIKGKTLNSARVFINGRLAITDSNGGFLLKINLNSGDNIIKIKAVDEASNETNSEIKVFYQP